MRQQITDERSTRHLQQPRQTPRLIDINDHSLLRVRTGDDRSDARRGTDWLVNAIASAALASILIRDR
jgi:hypothetical protein